MAKRKSFSTDPGPRFVSYDAYLSIHERNVLLTTTLNNLINAITSNGSPKLIASVSQSCPSLPAMPPPESPISFPAPLSDPFSTNPSKITKTGNEPLSTSVSHSTTTPSLPLNATIIAREAAKMIDKSTRVVIERMPDNKDDNGQDHRDLAFFQKLAQGNQLPCPTKLHRHQCTSRYRPLKLQFDTSTDRDSFLHGFHRIRSSDPSIANLSTKIRARRDLTLPELETLRASRKFVYDENKKAGTSKYIMSDINYKVNSKPRPFV